MRPLFIVIFLSTIFFSCSKEENIPFKEAAEDTIDLKFYHNIAGTYVGELLDIEWFGDSAYQELDKRAHTVVIKEIDFSFVELDDISNLTEGSVQAEMFRVNNDGSYIRFVGGTMPDSAGIDSVFFSSVHFEKMNGIFYYLDSAINNNRLTISERMQYFLYVVRKKDTIHQVFNYEYEKRMHL